MPAPTQRVRIEGLRELERNLLELADQYGPKNAISALRAPMRSSLSVVANRIRQNTPVDTGALRESTTISITQNSRRLSRSRFIPSDAVIVGRVGWFWRRGQSLWNASLSTEYGNRTTPAQPTLRPAFPLLVREAMNTFADGLGASIETTAARLGRRAAAGTLRRR